MPAGRPGMQLAGCSLIPAPAAARRGAAPRGGPRGAAQAAAQPPRESCCQRTALPAWGAERRPVYPLRNGAGVRPARLQAQAREPTPKGKKDKRVDV